jgi:pyrroline-5-carboxylate reductase
MEINRIAILGAGNLGYSIAKGLVFSGLISKKKLILTEKSPSRQKALVDDGFNAIENNVTAVKSADLIMLVVKPFQIDELLLEIKDHVAGKVIVSCVTGIQSSHIYGFLESKPTLFRVMPNTGIALQESMSCISSFNETAEQKEAIKTIFSQLGQVLFIPEEQMPAATALAGCGIAFALRSVLQFRPELKLDSVLKMQS